MKKNCPQQGFLNKHNKKIHSNLWKFYAVGLSLGVLIITLKGF
ncbi:hypothetical protein [Arcobacter sp. CECT 8985]|nr:hypothetical protein [Arcobacter sp. CECT 8985]